MTERAPRDREPGFENRNVTGEQMQIRSIPCPTCRVQPGVACTGTHGPRKRSHLERARRAGFV